MGRLNGTAQEAAGVPPLRRNRDFLLLWSGAAVSFLGTRVTGVSYPLIVLWHTDSPLVMSVVSFAALLPLLLVQLPAGVLVDRWDRRRLMALCETGRFLALGSVALTLAAGRFSAVQLAAVAFVETSLAIVYRLAERGAVRNVVDPTQLSAALARNEARGRASVLLGQPGGVLLQSAARWAPFLFSALAGLLSLATLLLIRKDFQEKRTSAAKPLRADLAEGLRWLWRRRFLRAALAFVAGSNLLLQVLPLALVVLVKEEGRSQATVALIVGVGGAGGIIGALSGGWWQRRTRLRTVLVAGLSTWAALIAAMFLTAQPLLLGVLFAGTGYVTAVFNVAAAVYQIRTTPDRLQGRVAATSHLVATGANVLGVVLGGLILSLWGAAAAFLLPAAVMAVLAVSAALTPALRTEDSPTDPPTVTTKEPGHEPAR
ncbi:MFS transporter [Streptomyces sp. NBC_01013]|uniref:MFS transporter n=1 Tax=Streptomyces sp. NBC_01013 TaxID=2903718 RepID=UPI003867C3D1|nr:MFS transporter [Streptomyces sp. NBC_01013]